jgi:ATP-dependent Lhr-like helicase
MGGRWALVADLVDPRITATERLHTRTLQLLDRHGVLTRESLAIEAGSGGFSALYRVLRAMEEAGKIRRGYFVEGLGGAQFAYPGVVDRLRRVRDAVAREEPLVLAATDPANPFGWLLPWPEFNDSGGRPPQRSTAARVVLVEGQPVLHFSVRGRRIRIRAGADDGEVERAAEGLKGLARHLRRHTLEIERIDADAALASPRREVFEQAGFQASYKVLRYQP